MFRKLSKNHTGLFILIVIAPLFVVLFAMQSTTSPAFAQSAGERKPDQIDEPFAPVSGVLAAQLANTSGTFSFLVVLDEQLDAHATLESSGVSAADHQTRVATLYARLTEQALRTQAPLRVWLDANSIDYTPFYLVNMIEVRGDASVVDALRRRSEVNRLSANPRIKNIHAQKNRTTWLEEIVSPNLQASIAQIPTLPYGLEMTGADEVWAMGYTGQGIIVASQDTGVEWDHPGLKANYRGYISATQTISHTFNWFDAWGNVGRPARCSSDPSIPCDDGGHGSHTVGTMVGDARAYSDTILGMAPGAQWIGCRNMNNGLGTPASYTACFEFMLAPYPQGGDKFLEGRPELTPHIINNSWGCPPSEGCDANALKQIVETVRAAGILVVASAGNNGSSCSTTRDPIGIYDASFTVGAHDPNGNIASFSSRGPVLIDGSKRRKPDISAPGVSTRSVGLTTSNNPFNFNDSKQGTSMAAPHVAGAAALLWSAAPGLLCDIDLTELVLMKSATPVSTTACASDSSTALINPLINPLINNVYGAGRLNILAAVQMAQNPASLHLTLLDCAGNGAANLPIQVSDLQYPFVYSQTTTLSGTTNFSSLFVSPLTDTFKLAFFNPALQFAPIAVDLHAGNHVSMTLQAHTCTPPATLSISVVDQSSTPLTAASVKLFHAATDTEISGQTDAAGNINFGVVYSGDYKMKVARTLACGGFEDVTLSLEPGSSRSIVRSPEGFCSYLPLIGN